MKPVASQDHRNLRTLVSRRLPSKIFNRLREIGALADAMDAPAYLVGGLVRDLLRRDLPISALAIRLNVSRFGELVDVYGGLRDLEHKVIRVLHARSFVDDPTRVFRAIRFEQRFGFRIEKRTLTLLKEAAASDLVHRLSGPRLRNEVMRLLSEQAPIRTIRRMAEFDLLRFLHTGLAWTA